MFKAMMVISRIVAGIVIGLFFFAIGVFVHGLIFDTSTIVSIHQPILVWVLGGVGFLLGFKYALNVFKAFVDNVWQIF